MKICIDARSPGYAGVLNYAKCLLTSLIEIDKQNEYIILRAPKDTEWNLPGTSEKVLPSNNPLRWTIWSNTELPTMLQNEKVDVYHSLKHVTAFRGNCKKSHYLPFLTFLLPSTALQMARPYTLENNVSSSSKKI
jgi:hypothetical protein